MSMRDEFEKHFPRPDGVFWDSHFGRYETNEMEFEPDADEYDLMWRVWQAARAQSGQGAEPVVDIGTQEREGFWQQPIDKYTQPAQQGSVPEGWKLVPVDPTTEMRYAYHEAYQRYLEGSIPSPDGQWWAMLDASPQPPQEGE